MNEMVTNFREFPPINEQMDLLRRNTVEILSETELEEKLHRSKAEHRPLKVKLGADPSRPDLHLGHAVVLKKLRDFQDLGHHAILIIGDFTAMIGDPSGKNKTRPQLTYDETRQNGQTYFEQTAKILDPQKTEIRYNSEWLRELRFEEVIRLSSRYTVARMLERDDFEKRYRNNEPIAIHEFLYPLAQAMDSVALQNDVELGGSDQKFNLLVARDIQREYGMSSPQVCITMPLLEGIYGVQKMSKSLDNYIGFNDPPQVMFQRLINIADVMMEKYARLTGLLSASECDELTRLTASHPREAKHYLALKITTYFHSQEAAFIQKRLADGEVSQLATLYHHPQSSIGILDALVQYGKIVSKSEARRLIQQGGVAIGDKKVDDPMLVLELSDAPVLIKAGKKTVFRLVILPQ